MDTGCVCLLAVVKVLLWPWMGVDAMCPYGLLCLLRPVFSHCETRLLCVRNLKFGSFQPSLASLYFRNSGQEILWTFLNITVLFLEVERLCLTVDSMSYLSSDSIFSNFLPLPRRHQLFLHWSELDTEYQFYQSLLPAAWQKSQQGKETFPTYCAFRSLTPPANVSLTPL